MLFRLVTISTAFILKLIAAFTRSENSIVNPEAYRYVVKYISLPNMTLSTSTVRTMNPVSRIPSRSPAIIPIAVRIRFSLYIKREVSLL